MSIRPLADFQPPASVGAVVTAVQEGIVGTAGSALVGLYVCGSLVTGDFEAAISDIDMIAVLAQAPDAQLAAALRSTHSKVASTHPQWKDRIEVIYVSADGLANFRSDIHRIAVISPGEPFHVIEAGRDWVLSWYPARKDAIALLGPPIDAVVPDISDDEYVAAVQQWVRDFTGRIPENATRGSQAYAVLSVCRGLYTCRVGGRLSKIRAAEWGMREFPEWSGLIRDALVWRKGQWTTANTDGAATVLDTRRFVADMAQRVR